MIIFFWPTADVRRFGLKTVMIWYELYNKCAWNSAAVRQRWKTERQTIISAVEVNGLLVFCESSNATRVLLLWWFFTAPSNRIKGFSVFEKYSGANRTLASFLSTGVRVQVTLCRFHQAVRPTPAVIAVATVALVDDISCVRFKFSEYISRCRAIIDCEGFIAVKSPDLIFRYRMFVTDYKYG